VSLTKNAERFEQRAIRELQRSGVSGW